MILPLSSKYPKPRIIKQAVNILLQGGLIAYPTDTTYGIGCDLFNKEAIQKLYRLKRLDNKKPLSLICSSISQASEYAWISDYSFRALKKILPGPFTFIFKATRIVPKYMLTKQKTVGIRIPDHIICQMLTECLGHPIMTTSSISDDSIDPVDPEELDKKYGYAIDMVLDDGIIIPQFSSVVEFIDDNPLVIREGIGDCSIFK